MAPDRVGFVGLRGRNVRKRGDASGALAVVGSWVRGRRGDRGRWSTWGVARCSRSPLAAPLQSSTDSGRSSAVPNSVNPRGRVAQRLADVPPQRVKRVGGE